MVIPKGVNIPMPKPYGGIPPAISKTTLDSGDGELITVSLSGEIGPVTQYLEFIDALDNAKENDQVRIVISSPGGDVYTTQQLVERMESCKATVTTIASGLVASAATMIWLYGDQQEVKRWARFMFHSSLHGDWNKSLIVKENATELVKFMASILSAAEKRGILMAKEVMAIMNGKADVELSGATMRKRLAEGETTEPETEEPAQPAEGEEETPEVAPAAPADKAKKAKKNKKRRAEGEEEVAAPAETPDEEEGGEEEAAPAEAPAEAPASLYFDAICEENGVPAPETEPETTEGEEEEEEGEETPAPAEAPAAKRAKKAKKRRAEGDEVAAPEETPAETEEEGEEAEPAATPAPEAKKVKKAKKRRAEGDEVAAPEEEPTEEPAAPAEPAEGETESPSDFFDTICEENGVEAPEVPETETDDDDDDDEDDDDEECEEGEAAAPAAKCGSKKKAKKPSKKRRGDDVTIPVTSPDEAEKQSDAQVVPTSRYW